MHQSVPFKKSNFPGLSAREYRISQGFDSAAALVSGSDIVTAVAEERFTREKATGAFPVHAINHALAAGGLKPAAVDWVAHGFFYEPFKDYYEETDFTRKQYEGVYSPDVQRRNLAEFLPGYGWEHKLVPVAHHLAHAASTFYPSGFSESLILISDGMGEVHSMTVAVGQGRNIKILTQIPALHSLGILYGVFTLYLGFYFGVDEYKVMGLAPYGNPRRYFNQVSELVRFKDDGTYTIPILASNQTPLEKETHRGVLRELTQLFGPPRDPAVEVSERDRDIAAALQSVVQNTQLHVLRHFRRETGMDNLCLAGGVALNCSANGIIRRSRIFKRMFIQPAAGDDGAALGAALYVAAERSPEFKPKRMTVPLWGPEFSRDEIGSLLAGRDDCDGRLFTDFTALCREVAALLADGKIVAWFQGKMEYGPRALGSRSILADPRDPGMRDRINALVKKREGFRPFAPVVKSESATRYFDIPSGDEETFAHMLLITQVRTEYQAHLPAITHIDGSARPQTVARDNYPQLWNLLDSFEGLTGLPILLNTSFNVKGQPIVCSPSEALDTFLFAGIHALVLGDYIVLPKPGEAGQTAGRAAGERIVIGVG